MTGCQNCVAVRPSSARIAFLAGTLLAVMAAGEGQDRLLALSQFHGRSVAAATESFYLAAALSSRSSSSFNVPTSARSLSWAISRVSASRNRCRSI